MPAPSRWEEPAPPSRAGRLGGALMVMLALGVAGLVAGGVARRAAPAPRLPVERGGPEVAERVQRWAVAGDRPAIPGDGPVDGVLAVGVRGGALQAVDAVTGARRWSFEERRTSVFGLAGAPGMVMAVGGRQSLHAFDAVTGRRRWSYDPRQGRTMTIPPVAADGLVFVATAYYPHGLVAAVDATTGAEQWRTSIPAPPYFGLTSAHHAVLAAWGRGITGLDARTGAVRWQRGTLWPPFVGAGGGLAAIAAGRQLEVVTADTGIGRWTRDLPTGVRGAPTVVADVSGGLVLATLDDGSVEARGALDGEVRWRCACAAVSPPAFSDGTVRVGTAEGVLALDAASGARRWAVRLGLPVRARPASAGGVTYLVTAQDVRRIDDPPA